MTVPREAYDREADFLLATRCALEPPDEEAWKRLWGRYDGLLSWRVRQALPGSLQNDVEDIVLEAFMRFRKAALEYDPSKSSLTGYLVVIAKSAAFDWIRRRRQEQMRAVAFPENWTDWFPTGLEADPDDFIAQARRALVHITNPRKRKAFEAFVALKTAEEVRSETGFSLATVYRLQSQFRDWLLMIAGSLARDPGQRLPPKKISSE